MVNPNFIFHQGKVKVSFIAVALVLGILILIWRVIFVKLFAYLIE